MQCVCVCLHQMADHGPSYGRTEHRAEVRAGLAEYERRQGNVQEGFTPETAFFLLVVTLFGFCVYLLVEFHKSCDIWGKLFGLCGVLWFAWVLLACMFVFCIRVRCRHGDENAAGDS